MCLWSKCNVRKFEKVLQKYNLSKNSLVKCLSVDNKFDIWIRITGEIFCHKSLANLQIDFQIIFAIWFTNFFCYKFVLIFFNDISGILKYCFIYRHCPKIPRDSRFWLASKSQKSKKYKLGQFWTTSFQNRLDEKESPYSIQLSSSNDVRAIQNL